VTTEPLQLSELFQVNMPVKDLDRAVAFYRDVLGLPFHARRGSLAFLSMGRVRLLLEVLGEEGGRYAHPGSVLYFRVPEIREAHHQMKKRGVEFIEPPQVVSRNEGGDLWMAFFSDGEWNTHAIVSDVPV
jgi:methylmalonyl-CoA/ethylmalonyl-CoA epimerase